MSFREILGAALAIAVCITPSLGQMRPASRPTYSIYGYVRDASDQHAMENVRVELHQSSGASIDTTFTRGNGEFEFPGLVNGDYIVEAGMDGYEKSREPVSILNSSNRGLVITLARPVNTDNASANSGNVISAHQLSVPHKAHDEFDKGIHLLYDKLDYQGAIDEFGRAIKDYPTYYEAYSQEAIAYLSLGQSSPAEAALRKSVELSSSHFSEALFMLAGLLCNTNRCAEAETFARQGAAVDPSSWHGPFELARVLLGLKKLDEAEKSAIQARDLKPDNAQTYLVLANIDIQRQDPEAILKDLNAFLKLQPSGPVADRARKTRDQVQADLEEDEARARINQGQSSASITQEHASDQAGGQDPSTHQSHAKTQQNQEPADPEDELLPPLPPPNPQNYE
jgi:tetratricopeptide (TPR) repeat protein